jgi:hypothetical protein
MFCAYDGHGGRRIHGWTRRLRIAAAVVTIIASVPGVFATIAFVARSIVADAPQPQPPPPQPQSPKGKVGPGRCPTYHVFRDGRCRDVR